MLSALTRLVVGMFVVTVTMLPTQAAADAWFSAYLGSVFGGSTGEGLTEAVENSANRTYGVNVGGMGNGIIGGERQGTRMTLSSFSGPTTATTWARNSSQERTPCGIGQPAPQLRDPAAARDRPAVTTHNHDNHGVRSERWRFIQYADGSEELYDMEADPDEWRNLIADPQFVGVVEEHRQWLPESAPPAPGSRARILTYRDGQAVWQDEPIGADEPVPEI